LPGGKKMSGFGHFGMDEHPVWQRWFESWKNKEEVFIAYLEGQEKEEYFKNINDHNNYLPQRIVNFPDNFFQAYYFEQGAVWVYSLSEHSESEKDIMKRFTKGFSLTFRRYQDLKKAEAQTRQAQIETAMEKVRARALAMQKPEELVEVAEVLRKEMGLLGVEELETSSIYIQDEVSGNTECWYAIKKTEDDETKLVTDHMIIKLKDTWVGRQMLDFNNSDKKQISIPMQGENRKEWINYCSRHSNALEGFYGENIPDRTYHLNKFSNGYIGAASPGDISAESWDLLQRATNAFSLAYTRFSDLQKSEVNARAAIKQAALDRVRAEIASMRTIADLDKITPLIWNELTILGVPFIRCGVFIMDESQKLIHTFLSTPDGKAIAAFHLPYDTPGNFAEVVNHWHGKQLYIDHWGEPEFINMADTLVKQRAIEKKEQYLNTLPAGGFYLHFLPFLQGMLYVANTTQLGNEELTLIQSVADAFSTAYARYEDFNKLEAAKQTVEKTLTNLKQTQAQLIQSEKMASLGELTAGIAHEIQNPLNFVNNFSEVSNELIEEMNAEIEKGDMEEAKSIANDIKQNLEKILHHGKRADGIVKGMLQHSRSSSATKEPTDINKLADEYLRLAYHGLRAKDKSFNATLETDYDETIGSINIIPQDIGRAVLNLITNAFYAVTEKKNASALRQAQDSAGQPYEPTVSVSTKRAGDKVEIKVKDNGNGIPQKVLDKIFQPFFTTKPTGQGTGLGLSLSYDIVKAHGGELKVETKEGEGSEFIISLPG
jgi:signal transduction histidine kinase